MDKKLEYQKYQDLRDRYQAMVSRIANIRIVLFIIMIISFILKYYYYPLLFQIVFVVSMLLFVIMVLIHDKYFKVYDYYTNYVQVIDTYLDRERGTWKSFSDKGEDFINSELPFLQDLDILGDCSLFQYLSVCKTLGGREKLYKRLSNIQLSKEELLRSQEAVSELAENHKFMIDFQVAMKYYEGKKIHLERDFSMFDMVRGNRNADFVIGIVASVICIGLLMLGLFNIIPIQYFYGMFLFNILISYLYSFIFKEEFACLDKMVYRYGKLSNVLNSVIKEKFHSSLLKDIQKTMKKGKEEVLELNKIDGMNSLKSNLLSNLFFNGFGCLNLFLLYRFTRFVNYNLDYLKANVAKVEELEVLVSLATLGVVRTNYCEPSLTEEVSLEFLEIKHPLLDEEVCVANDFSSNAGVYIITGSNMGGKTSFLRMIGINLILMQAGGLVCAKSFKASYFKLFTSMRIADNIEKGISTFYGELLRIQEMVQYVEQGKMLVLIDEIFKGTNYQDRMYGAKEVIRKLNTKKTIVFLTTHDFELCEEARVHNYHVREEYEGDKIIFDYKIRKGKCSSTNAKYLMKRLGIID